jgi:hypothetical protein
LESKLANQTENKQQWAGCYADIPPVEWSSLTLGSFILVFTSFSAKKTTISLSVHA